MPITDPARRREIRRRYEARNPGRRTTTRHAARTRRRDEHVVTFVGIDGEGVDRPDGSHDYNLLSVGERSLYRSDGSRLSTTEVFRFLWSSQIPGAAHVGFFLSYDFSQWLRDLPTERARMLLTTKGQIARRRTDSGGNPVPYPVRWKGWAFDMLPNGKRFKLRPACELHPDRDCKCDKPPWLYICDAGPLYQTSLLTAIDPDSWPTPVCTPDEYALIERGKRARSDNLVGYGTPVDPVTIAYNVLENDVLARLMARTNEGLVAMGVRLGRAQWHGPGQAAQAWLKATAREHDGATCRTAAPSDPDGGPFDAARRSYFGGWFEIMAHGPLPGLTYEYDVNSAYPHIIADLPCLLHGRWEHGRGVPPLPAPAGDLASRPPLHLVEAEVTGSDPNIGAMLHRTPKGAVCRPHRTSGWYWLHELKAARRAGLIDRAEIRQWWRYTPCDCPPPFGAIRDLYLHRIAVGKQTPQGRAMRLVYNSSYGKIAQSVGDPLFGNSVYASLITSGCRTMITDAIASHPQRASAVVMVATDGVYFSSPHPTLDVDAERLGAWDGDTKRNLSLFKPGVYWDDKARDALAGGGKLKLRSRGVNAKALSEQIAAIDAQWAEFVPSPDPSAWPAVRLDIEFGVITARQALHRGKWSLCGSIIRDAHPKQSSAPHLKRGVPFVRDPWNGEDYVIRSSPLENRKGLASEPYDKRFGAELAVHLGNLPMLEEGEAAMLVAELLSMTRVHL